MRQAIVYLRGKAAGTLTEENPKSYIFRYNDDYYHNSTMPDICLSLSKKKQDYESKYLFPFFYNLLSEGANRSMQCSRLKIDEKDHFGLLLATATDDTIGAVTLKPVTV
jgi:HipA-like protein